LASYARGLQGDFGKCAQKPKDFRAFIDEQTKVYEDKK
jgi:hypothetical protein